jgi:uncharacterized protein with HEPN domain
MPSETDESRRWLADILHHIVLAETFVHGLTYEDFSDDLRSTYAVIRCLELISEAPRRPSDALKTRHPSIAWRAMAAAGNVYRHDYEDVAASAVFVSSMLRSIQNASRCGCGGCSRSPRSMPGWSKKSSQTALAGTTTRRAPSRKMATS